MRGDIMADKIITICNTYLDTGRACMDRTENVILKGVICVAVIFGPVMVPMWLCDLVTWLAGG